jgi:hypothetical protein
VIVRRITLFSATLALAVMLVACGPGGGGGGGDGGDEFPDAAQASSEDAEGTTFPLRQGRYRLSYTAPDCPDLVISVAEVSGAFSYEQHPRAFTTFINGMVDGEYTITVTSDCAEWTVNLNEF